MNSYVDSITNNDFRLNEEQIEKVTRLVSLGLSEYDAISLLCDYDWSITDVMDSLDVENRHVKKPLSAASSEENIDCICDNGGCINAGNSCYIDAVIFALFSCESAYDGLLRKELSDEKSYNVQSSLLYVVNRLRSGRVVSASLIESFRTCIVATGWPLYAARFDQQDAVEFLGELLDILQAPYLPFGERVLHGGRPVESDERVTTQRILHLPLFTDMKVSGSELLSLQEMLSNYFHQNQISVRRKTVDTGQEMSADALKVFYFLPEYTPNQNSSYTDDRATFSTLVLPINLMRYTVVGKNGQYERHMGFVDIPFQLNFSDFAVQDEHEHCISNVTLYLDSWVCHKGASSPNQGHYIAYSRLNTEENGYARGTDSFLRFDDLALPRVTKVPKNDPILSKELGQDAYLLMYRIVT